ncbi:hypothetical protein [Campylobacter helveticus]|uniref:hypothetical protein n=1 Tax=Campylobacter helveticus TaxID=28898 RepID=UPI0022EA223E|nr:hypothetical protein [Campylobacter helveticus]
MKKLLILLLCLSSTMFANTANVGNGAGQSTGGNIGETTAKEMEKIFKSPNDAVINNGKCTWECRDVKSGYVTQISGFDFKEGITYCRIYERNNLDEALVYNANRQNKQCIADIYTKENKKNEVENLLEIVKKNKNQGIESSIKYEKVDGKITMSQFLSSLVTLNPQIIDREKTNQLGELTLKDGIETFSTESIKTEYNAKSVTKGILTARENLKNKINSFFGLEGENQKQVVFFEDTYSKTSAVDGFNKNNMAYFSDLFLANEKIYQHLQILIFILVGGFFVSKIGAEKIQAYLENRGESAGKQPYLHKFYIPIIMVGTFFMPIPEANGLAHSTIMQNTIRYFAMKSTEIADMASAIGGKTYMDKIYKSVGGIGKDGFESLTQKYYLNLYKSTQAENTYKDTCSKRYTKPASSNDTLGYLKLSDKEKEEMIEQSKLDREKIAGTKYDITLEACIFLEQEINNAKLENRRLEETMQGIANFYSNSEAQNRLREIDTYFAIRETQLGWINSLLTPSSALLAEMASLAQYKTNKTDMETSTKKNIENNKNAMKNKDVDVSEGEVNGGVLGFVMGRLVWMMLPGANSVKDFVDTIYSFIAGIATALITLLNPTAGVASIVITILAKTPLVYFATTYILEEIYSKVPLLSCVVASVVAFISYLISLCKYFYVSPFVVAFSLATKRMDKIVEFLISGMAIFLRPTLIVIFIYLALFVHTLVNEIFIFLSIEQFTGFEIDTDSVTGFLTNLTANGIIGLLKIFGIIASAYLIWKLIISGPSWALSLVGIDGKHDDMISQGLENSLSKRAIVV